jgi:hypothetical protein
MNKKVVAAFGGLAAFGILTASAASLGGLTSSSLGADQTVVASCDSTGINMSYTTAYDAPSNSYKTTAVTISNVDPSCATKAYKLTMSDGSASLNETSGTVTLTSGSQTIALSAAVDSKAVTKAALVIS